MSNMDYQKVPIIAFFGTKGGVGKTTITNKFADLVASAEKRPKVLLIDFDVDARGTTILRTRGRSFSCKAIHDYIAERSSNVEEVIDVTDTIEVRGKNKDYKEKKSN
jgi:cellulose biosynthesis protein BcsQ